MSAKCVLFFFFKNVYIFDHVGSICSTGDLLAVTCGIWFPDQGSNSNSLHWELGVLATGPPGKSLFFLK